MTPHEKIDAYLRRDAEREFKAVDPRLRFIAEKAQEFYWTVSRLLGLERLHDGKWRTPSQTEAHALRETLETDAPAPPEKGRLLIDMTATHRYRKNSGVQRVVREIARACVAAGDALPVYIEDGRLYSHFIHPHLPDEVEFRDGDKWFLLDSGWGFWPEYPPLIEAAHRAGAMVVGCVYDIIPLRFPDATEPANCAAFVQWFTHVLTTCDALFCISKSVADELVDYAREEGGASLADRPIGWWPLGADFRAPTGARPSEKARAIAESGEAFFLSVGTLEPRKAYPVAIAAFEKLWREGRSLRYVIVGRPGWKTRALQRDIRRHPEFGRRLFWLDNADDADLAYLYQRARALIFPSFAEGFGMPLVEAAHFGAPVIASDIAVFREIGGENVTYFPLLDVDALASRLIEAPADRPAAAPQQPISWRQSASILAQALKKDRYQYDRRGLA